VQAGGDDAFSSAADGGRFFSAADDGRFFSTTEDGRLRPIKTGAYCRGIS
jgi:hypothetical protein